MSIREMTLQDVKKFYLEWGFYPIGGGGGGSQPEKPVAPEGLETSAEAITAQIEATPRILETQKEFGPQFTQLDLEQLQQFGPQFAETLLGLQQEFGPQITAALREEQAQLAPELTAAQGVLTEFLGQEDLLTPQEERRLQQDVRGAQNVRGFALESGLGAEQEIEELTRLRQELKTRRLNIALSTAGRVPISGGSQFQPSQQAFGPGQLVQNVAPSQIFGLAGQSFATQGSIFGAQSQAATAARGQNLQLIGAGLGATGSAAGPGFAKGGAFGCWVASEIFGGWYAPKTVAARYYVNNLAPKWFKNFYLKYGERIANFISDKPLVKMVVRPLFELFAHKGAVNLGVV